MTDYIHGSTRATEIARLEKQANFAAPFLLAKFDASPAMKVLDLGTGIGAMASELSRRCPGIELIAVDRNRAQLETARVRHRVADYVCADATELPFPSSCLDRVHASWLLEHVPDPSSVVREVFRVLKPGGKAFFVEVDNATFSTTPPLPHALELLAALDRAQMATGGDPYIGRRLEDLFRSAGFAQVEVEVHTLVGNALDPTFFAAFVTEFAEIFDSVREALGPTWNARIDEAVRDLHGLLSREGTEMRYQPVLLRAVR